MQISMFRQRLARPAVQRIGVGVILSLLTTCLAVIFMFPFLWSISSSLKKPFEVTAFPPHLLPKVPQWNNYIEAWTYTDFGVFFRNSLIVTCLSVLGQTASSFIVAYGFARYRFVGREFLFLLCLSGMMMPVYVTIIPLFDIYRRIGWLNTLRPLIVPGFFGSAFSIFLLRQFIMTITFELDEAAIIDGANRMTILVRILLPNCQPALATVAIFAFMRTWNSFLEPLIFIDSAAKYTLPLGLWFLRSSANDPGLPKEHLLMAASLITTLPVLAIFVVAQRYFIEGIVMSGIKG